MRIDRLPAVGWTGGEEDEDRRGGGARTRQMEGCGTLYVSLNGQMGKARGARTLDTKASIMSVQEDAAVIEQSMGQPLPIRLSPRALFGCVRQGGQERTRQF